MNDNISMIGIINDLLKFLKIGYCLVSRGSVEGLIKLSKEQATEVAYLEIQLKDKISELKIINSKHLSIKKAIFNGKRELLVKRSKSDHYKSSKKRISRKR